MCTFVDFSIWAPTGIVGNQRLKCHGSVTEVHKTALKVHKEYSKPRETDTASGRLLRQGNVSIRGNTDESWQHGLQSLLKRQIFMVGLGWRLPERIIVQLMVAAEVSGVLFTANPATGNRSEFVVDLSVALKHLRTTVAEMHFPKSSATGITLRSRKTRCTRVVVTL